MLDGKVTVDGFSEVEKYLFKRVNTLNTINDLLETLKFISAENTCLPSILIPGPRRARLQVDLGISAILTLIWLCIYFHLGLGLKICPIRPGMYCLNILLAINAPFNR